MSQPTNLPGANATAAEPHAADLLPSFLALLVPSHLGSTVVVHTGRASYTGRLLSVSPVSVNLESDSEVLDAPVHIRVDATRVEAVELLLD